MPAAVRRVPFNRNRRRFIGPLSAPLRWTAWGNTITRSEDPTHWAGTVTVKLEVHGKTSDAALPIRARLFNETTSTAIGPSEVSSTATSNTRVRSSSFSFQAGENVYHVEFGGKAGATYTLHDAALIVDTVAV